jgi:heme-degrading monooxygenase HmoA
MFSVAFEVKPKKERFDDYLALAAELKPILGKIDGFIDNERFESKRRAGWLLSHSTWRDEKSVLRWRTDGRHHAVQEKGRQRVFEDYHLRVGEVSADTAPPPEAPIRSTRLDETEIGSAKWLTLSEITPPEGFALPMQAELLPTHLGLDVKAGGLVDHDVFTSINTPGKIALLVSWRTAAQANDWRPLKLEGMKQVRHRHIRVVRDYGMFDRRESPQYYPDVEASGRETLHTGAG